MDTLFLKVCGAIVGFVGALLLAYSAAGPSLPPEVPSIDQGGSYNQEYQRKLREFPAAFARHKKAGWIGDRLVVFGLFLIIAGTAIPVAQRRQTEK